MTVTISSLTGEFGRNNESLEDWTLTVFSELCGDAQSAQLFLNTLSYMEHIGSYKIMATQRTDVMDYSTLKHLNEETGHAVLFKRHAERLSDQGIDYSSESLLAPATARAYFNRLEIGMVRLFGREANYRTVYLYMSMIVEFRAVWAYEILQKALDQNSLEVSLDRLLAEEQGHLYSMIRRLEADDLFNLRWVRQLWGQEQVLFIRLLKAIGNRLDQPNLKVA